MIRYVKGWLGLEVIDLAGHSIGAAARPRIGSNDGPRRANSNEQQPGHTGGPGGKAECGPGPGGAGPPSANVRA